MDFSRDASLWTGIFDNRKVDHPHIWGTDELRQKHLHGVFASEVISN